MIAFKHLTIFLLGGMISLFSFACGTTPTTLITVPAWFNQADMPGYTGISVSAAPQAFGGIEAQRRVALLKVHAELGRIQRVTVNTELVLTESSDSRDLQTQTRLSSTEALDVSELEIRDEWIDPTTQTLYIRVLIPQQ